MPLKVSDGMDAWIKDFQQSDAPQFKGKSKEDRRDQAIAAYLSAKRGDKKEDIEEAMTPKQKAELAKQVAAFKARGGNVKKLAPGKAQGYHGKDDPGKDMHGMMDKGDTKKIGTRKKVKSMGESIEENFQVQKYDAKGKKDGPPKSFGGNLKKATDYASKMGRDYRVHKEAAYGTQAQRLMSPLQKARQDKEKRDRDRDGKLKSTALPRKVKLKGFGPDHAKGNMGNPSARAALKPKTEQYMHEGIDTDKFQAAERDLAQYAQKHGGMDKRQFMDIAKMLGQIGRINILQAGQVLATLNRKLKAMDTDPRDKVYEILKQNKLMEGNGIPFAGPYKKAGEPRKDRFGNTIKTSNVARHLAKTAAQKLADKQKKKPIQAQKSCSEEVELDEAAGGMFFKVSVSGLPDLVMIGRSPGDIKSQLRKIVKQPSMITDVERMTKAEVKKRYRDLALGDMDDDDLQTTESTQAYAATMKKKQTDKAVGMLKPGEADKIKKIRDMMNKERMAQRNKK